MTDGPADHNKESVQTYFSGLSTFLKTPYEKDLSAMDIALIGVPFDGGVTCKAGTRHGPSEVRKQSGFVLGGTVNHQTKIDPFKISRVCDFGDVNIKNIYHLDESIKEIEFFYRRIAQAKVRPLSVGGDHSITYPILKALGTDRPLGVIQFDAHCDTTSEQFGSKYHHGSAFRNAVELGVLDPKRTIQIGIRGTSEELWGFSFESGMRVVHIEEFREMGIRSAIELCHQVVSDGPTYISFDIDGLDPAYAPGTGTPEIGGLTTYEVQQVLRGLRGLHLVGGDLVEVSPPFDPSGMTALTGAAIMFEILCLLAESLTHDVSHK